MAAKAWKCDWDAVDESAGLRDNEPARSRVTLTRRSRDPYLCSRCGLRRPEECVCEFERRENYRGNTGDETGGSPVTLIFCRGVLTPIIWSAAGFRCGRCLHRVGWIVT